MARYVARANLNKKAMGILRRSLKKDRLRIGVIVASIFVEIRLRTLISYDLEAKKVGRSQIRDLLRDERWTLNRLAEWAGKLKIITGEQKGKLRDLAAWRNKVAHQANYWTTYPDLATQQTLRSACENAIRFMEETTGPVD